jgi:hypothetical protein
MAKKDEGFLVDTDGNPVQSSSGEYVRSGSYDDEKVTQNRRKAAEDKLAADVQKKLKDDSDSDRLSYDAEQGAKAPAPAKKAPAKKAPAKKAPVVTKEELAKSGLSLRDYMNKQRGLTRRDGKAAEKAPAKTQSSQKETSAPVNRARHTPEGSEPQHYASPAYMRHLARKEMEESRAKIQPQRREEQGVSKRRKDLADSLSEVGKGFSAVPGGIGGVGNLVKRVKAEPDKYTRPDEASMKKGGSVRGVGIAQRGVRKCKMV